MFTVGNTSATAHSLAKNANECGTQPSVNPQIQMAKPPVTAEEPLLAEINAFLQAVRDRSRPVVSLEDGRKALALGLAILAEIGRHADHRGRVMTEVRSQWFYGFNLRNLTSDSNLVIAAAAELARRQPDDPSASTAHAWPAFRPTFSVG